MTLEQIKTALLDRRPGMVSQATGLHVNTILDVRDNPHANPTNRVLVALSAYLESRQNG